MKRNKKLFKDEIIEELHDQYKQQIVWIPSGKYALGDHNSQNQFIFPTDGYYITKYLVTNEDYAKFLNSLIIPNEIGGTFRWINCDLITVMIKNRNTPYFQDITGTHRLFTPLDQNKHYSVIPGYELHPVKGVNWYGAMFFANMLGGRLPTEAEWEAAAKGGKGDAIFPWGNSDPTLEKANFGENVGFTSEIGRYPPNPYGLYDMAGNVRQWCMDWHHPNIPYLQNRGIKLPEKMQVNKVIKGGGWNKPPSHLKCYERVGKWLRLGGASIGFRIVFKH